MSPNTLTNLVHPNSNHRQQESPSFHGFWPYFSLVCVAGIISAVLLYALHSCYRSAGATELARIRNVSAEDLEKKEQAGLDEGLGRRGHRTRMRRYDEWAKFHRKSSESVTEAKKPILGQDFFQSTTSLTGRSEHSRLSSPNLPSSRYRDSTYSVYSPVHSPILPLPSIYDPARILSSSPTILLQEPPNSPLLSQESVEQMHNFDRSSIPFVSPEKSLSVHVDPRLGPIGGAFGIYVPLDKDVSLHLVKKASKDGLDENSVLSAYLERRYVKLDPQSKPTTDADGLP
ncbi:hypothetical protein PQX77_020375 [Marasmius sp. AFHP31]|nr:hypothetical protein PQX77_020375 [Marasmius sp. AFHP31]